MAPAVPRGWIVRDGNTAGTEVSVLILEAAPYYTGLAAIEPVLNRGLALGLSPQETPTLPLILKTPTGYNRV
jgi:hypothetical protein